MNNPVLSGYPSSLSIDVSRKLLPLVSLCDHLPLPRADEVSLQIPITQCSVAVLKILLMGKGC